MTRLRLALPLLAACALGACDSADPGPGIASETEPTLAAPAGPFSLYALRTSGTGAATTATAVSIPQDSAATTAWDIGLRGTDVVLNGGASGPGAGVGVVVPVPFESVRDARLDAVPYRRDGESACPAGPPRAVCPGDLFTPGAGEPRPIPGRTLVLRLGDNRGYAKVVVDGYAGDPAGGVYTLRFTVNPQGPSFDPDADE